MASVTAASLAERPIAFVADSCITTALADGQEWSRRLDRPEKYPTHLGKKSDQGRKSFRSGLKRCAPIYRGAFCALDVLTRCAEIPRFIPAD